MEADGGRTAGRTVPGERGESRAWSAGTASAALYAMLAGSERTAYTAVAKRVFSAPSVMWVLHQIQWTMISFY